MQKIDKMSRATIQFGLDWNSGAIQHCDQLWTDRVNMWRDIFPEDLATALFGKQEGEKAAVNVNAGSFPEHLRNRKTVGLKPSCLYRPGEQGISVPAVPGRFYPQGFLHGIPGIFQTSTAPARCISQEDNRLSFDLNHPLADYDLTISAEILSIHPEKVERGGRCEEWLEQICANGPGMQARYQGRATDFFAPRGMRPADTSPDHLFYEKPRMVQHLDATARQTIRDQYGKLIAPGARVLDLMGSWDSHLSENHALRSLTVLGMNRTELEANPLATESVVRDLNQDPSLPFAENSFDAVLCTASIEYLINPLAVFTEIQRILAPGGVLAVAFSNRWFPPKAVRIWTELHEFERLGMVLEMFQRTPGFSDIHTFSRRGEPRPEDDPHQEIRESDPVFIAWATGS
ncbi:MAG TPA: methyltransferase domain-containing protein [Desulfobulbus sp.]|nr:methyltransferase domain-containing protein [Desulfobulbus sp.]HHD63780.1 methyltransferase domain-containing protein [Desulfobulbaceae bacterium]